MRDAIATRALELGFDVCRITTAAPPESGPQFLAALSEGRHGAMEWLARNASKRIDPQLVLDGVRSVLVLGISYHVSELDPENQVDAESAMATPSAKGNVARYARHEDYHDVLVAPLKALTEYVQTLGGVGTRSLWYVDTGPVLERDLAQRAGVGFVGKHTNLVSRTHGNWLLLAEILTTLQLEPDAPEKNRCGHCTRCLDSCPTHCITAPFKLDARRCISYLTIELKGSIPLELRPLIGNRIFGCDDCLAVCPWNRFAKAGSIMRHVVRRELATPDLLDLLRLTNDEFKRQFAGTPILRSKRRGLLRNVCVALGNIGTVDALSALETAATDPEPLIAEHARWAIEQIQRRHCPSHTESVVVS